MDAFRPKVIIAQVNSSITLRFGLLIENEGFDLKVVNGEDGPNGGFSAGLQPDLCLIDSAIKDPNPVELCRGLKALPSFSMVPIMILETSENGISPVETFEAGCDDLLPHPVRAETLLLRIRSLFRLKSQLTRMDDSESVLYTLARTMEAKDHYTMGHADRVSQYAVQLGKQLHVKSREVDTLRRGGMLHDLGKIAIPDAILTKPGRYTPEEFAIMKKHPVLGCEICEKLRSVNDALPLIRHHHEKLDGTGYPDGLSGRGIPMLVRIVTVVDIYDALRSKRSYKEAFTVDKTFEIMWEEAEKGWWDKTVLSAWEEAVRSNRLKAPF